MDVKVLTGFEVATFDLVTVLLYGSAGCHLKFKPFKSYSSLILAFCFHLKILNLLVFIICILQ